MAGDTTSASGGAEAILLDTVAGNGLRFGLAKSRLLSLLLLRLGETFVLRHAGVVCLLDTFVVFIDFFHGGDGHRAVVGAARTGLRFSLAGIERELFLDALMGRVDAGHTDGRSRPRDKRCGLALSCGLGHKLVEFDQEIVFLVLGGTTSSAASNRLSNLVILLGEKVEADEEGSGGSSLPLAHTVGGGRPRALEVGESAVR